MDTLIAQTPTHEHSMRVKREVDVLPKAKKQQSLKKTFLGLVLTAFFILVFNVERVTTL